MKKTIIMAGVVALSLGCWLADSPGNAETERSSAAASPFKGGIVVVGLKSAEPDLTVILKKATVHELANRYFLVGISADDDSPGGWMNGQTVWVPIDDASMITEFANIDEYKKTAPAETERRAERPRY